MTWVTFFWVLAACFGVAALAFAGFTILMWFAFRADRRLFATWHAASEHQPEHPAQPSQSTPALRDASAPPAVTQTRSAA
jgi:hypothetical protein